MKKLILFLWLFLASALPTPSSDNLGIPEKTASPTLGKRATGISGKSPKVTSLGDFWDLREVKQEPYTEEVGGMKPEPARKPRKLRLLLNFLTRKKKIAGKKDSSKGIVGKLKGKAYTFAKNEFDKELSARMAYADYIETRRHTFDRWGRKRPIVTGPVDPIVLINNEGPKPITTTPGYH